MSSNTAAAAAAATIDTAAMSSGNQQVSLMDELLQPVSIPATHVSEISTDNSDICDIQENDFLLFGDKTLVLNSVLAYAYHTLGPINTKLLSHQLCEFYDGDKLLSAYKLIFT